MTAGNSSTGAMRARSRRWRRLLPNHRQIFGVVCLIFAYELFAWWVFSENLRRADRMFLKLWEEQGVIEPGK